MAQGCIVAVANCKGGCGKTTTAVNVAAELAARGFRVALVDLDPQGHSGLALGLRGERVAVSAHDLLSGARPGPLLRRAGIDVLPADPDFRIPSPAPRARAFAESLAPLAAGYDVTLIDAPPALDLPLIAALAAAHRALTPTQLTPLARDGVMRFSQAFFYASATLNPDLAAFAVAPVQVDLRTRVQQVALARLIADFGPQRIYPLVRHDTALAEAFETARPIRLFRPGSRGAADYSALTDRIVTEWLAPPPPAVARRRGAELSPPLHKPASPEVAVPQGARNPSLVQSIGSALE